MEFKDDQYFLKIPEDPDILHSNENDFKCSRTIQSQSYRDARRNEHLVITLTKLLLKARMPLSPDQLLWISLVWP